MMMRSRLEIGSMTPTDRLKSAARSAHLPLALLLLALSTVFIFRGDRAYFYRCCEHNGLSSQHLALAVNLSPEHRFLQFERRVMDEDGAVRYKPYNRFPIGGYASMKAASLLFEGSPSAQLYAARILMLLFFAAAAVLAYLSLCRLASNRWIALTATLLTFSSYYLLYYNDMTANEGIPDFFGVMLTFHGMVLFVQEGRFRQLLIKTCIALLLGWHVYAILLPFVIFGLAIELMRARSAASPHSPTLLHRGRHAALALLHSKYLLLGAAALVLGLAILTFNFAMEYAALDGETPLTELPSFQSMLIRTGADSEFNDSFAANLAWRPLLVEQFRRMFQMFIPYSVLGGGGVDESPTWLPRRMAVVLGAVLSAACLIGSMFVRPRILFVTLASFGFFWALPMRNSIAFTHFETIYYVGVPLVFFTILLLLARRLTNRDGVIAAAAVAALLLFTASSFQMSRTGYNDDAARIAREADQDLLAIRDAAAGEVVTILHLGGSHKDFFRGASYAMNHYLKSSFIWYRYLQPPHRGFVVMRERIDTDALLTPQNQQFFLYDTPGLVAWYQSTYRSIASSESLARQGFDLYIDDGKVYYLKEPCEETDTWARFFLHVYPIDENDLPNHRRQHGFDNSDFEFITRGLLFDGKCLAIVALPMYAVDRINTGRLDGDHTWRVELDVKERE